jgi:hypothetical protein
LHSKSQGLDKKEQKALTHKNSRTLSTTTTLSSLFFQLVNRKKGTQSPGNIVAQKMSSSKINNNHKPDLPALKFNL